MFYWFYPMNGLYTYNMGTAMGRLLMDMRAQIPKQNADVYYTAIGGVSKGPYSFDELRELIREKQVTRETYIWKPQMEDWDFAANIAEIRPLVSFTPPPVPVTREGEDEDQSSENEKEAGEPDKADDIKETNDTEEADESGMSSAPASDDSE